MIRFGWRAALAWLALTILQAVIGGLLLPQTPAPRGLAGWSLVTLSNALNPYMPDAVRIGHLCEVGISNLLFGWLAAWLLAGREALRPLADERLLPEVQ